MDSLNIDYQFYSFEYFLEQFCSLLSKLFSSKIIYYNIDGRIDDKEQIAHVDQNVESDWYMIPENVNFEIIRTKIYRWKYSL